MKTTWIGVLCALAIVIGTAASAGSPLFKPWPASVLITNGDDVDLERLFTLAGAFAAFTETHVVIGADAWNGKAEWLGDFEPGVPFQWLRGKRLNVQVFKGTPAEALRQAFASMNEKLPELMIAGIGDRIRLDEDFSSELHEAARVAASFGVPAIAASGLNADDPAAMSSIPNWLVKFSASDLLDELEIGTYLFVQFPRASLDFESSFFGPARVKSGQLEPAVIAIGDGGNDLFLNELIQTYPSLLPAWPSATR